MSIADGILAELEHEGVKTRRALERVPREKFGFKPHPKSFSMRDLASHLTEVPGWGVAILKQDVFDMNPEEYKRPEPKDEQEILRAFDENLAAFKDALTSTSDERMAGVWTFKIKGETRFQMPRVAVLRTMVMNHLVHHRAQLGVYLRLNDVAVPAIYGPSADEAGM